MWTQSDAAVTLETTPGSLKFGFLRFGGDLGSSENPKSLDPATVVEEEEKWSPTEAFKLSKMVSPGVNLLGILTRLHGVV